jgi:hypothetical protein
MSFIGCQDAELDARVHRVCAPLFATDQFLTQGARCVDHRRDADLRQVRGPNLRRHMPSRVIGLRRDRNQGTEADHTEDSFRTLHSGHRRTDGHGGYRWGFKAPGGFLTPAQIDDSEASDALDRKSANTPDIAIAELTSMWPLLVFAAIRSCAILKRWLLPPMARISELWTRRFDEAHDAGGHGAASLFGFSRS